MGNMPNQLSGGTQRRVANATTLNAHHDTNIANEPTGNLDSRTSIEVMDIFQRLNRERGITVAIVTHEPDIAEYADRVVVFRDGRIRRDEPVARPRSAREELEKLPPLGEEDDE
jgi:ABC-type lipoprotein export system ATPase subunit